MNDIKDFIQARIDQNEKRYENWEEKIQAATDKINNPETTDGEIQYFKLQRERCIAKKNELLAVSDFGKEILEKYF